MSKLLSCVSAIVVSFALIGCGGAVDEVPAASESTGEATQEEQIDWSKESMKRGGAPKGMSEEEISKGHTRTE